MAWNFPKPPCPKLSQPKTVDSFLYYKHTYYYATVNETTSLQYCRKVSWVTILCSFYARSLTRCLKTFLILIFTFFLHFKILIVSKLDANIYHIVFVDILPQCKRRYFTKKIRFLKNKICLTIFITNLNSSQIQIHYKLFNNFSPVFNLSKTPVFSRFSPIKTPVFLPYLAYQKRPIFCHIQSIQNARVSPEFNL